MLEEDLIVKYKLPKHVVQLFMDMGKIFLFESNLKEKSFYLDYHRLMYCTLSYFMSGEEDQEEKMIHILSQPIEDVMVSVNRKLKEIRTESNHITTPGELEAFVTQYPHLYYGTMAELQQEKAISLEMFKDQVSKAITDVIVNNKYLVDFTSNYCINNALFEGINKEKFLLYLAGSTLHKCFQFEEVDPEIYYAINYYLHKTEEGVPNIQITVGDNSYSFLTFSKQLQTYLKTHPSVGMRKFKPDTFKGCSPKEVKGYLLELQNETLQNFDIVDTDDVYLPNGVDTGIKRERKKENEVKRKPAEISKLTLQKRKFYRENKEQIYMTLRGKNKFNGYVAHVFKNGYVIFEKHDRQRNMISNQSGAAYIMTIHNFNEFSKKSIPEIRDHVKRNSKKDISYLCHSGNWMERLQEVINKTTGINLLEIDRVMMKYKK